MNNNKKVVAPGGKTRLAIGIAGQVLDRIIIYENIVWLVYPHKYNILV